jgi:hypothetical protein
MTKKKAKEYSTGQMEENMTEAGKMENSMESETIPPPAESLSKASGKKAKDCIGCSLKNELLLDQEFKQIERL